MDFSRRSERAAQTAAWGSRTKSPELRQADAQCGEKPPRSMGGRLRDNGKRCFSLFKPFKLTRWPQAYTKDLFIPGGRQPSSSIRPVAASTFSRRFTMSDYTPRFPSLDDSNPPRDLDAVPSYESHAEFHATDVTGMMRHSALVERRPLRDSTYRDTEPTSNTNSLFSLDLEGSIKKPRQWLDRMRGYTIKRWDRLSSPLPGTSGSSGLGDLIGVGSQYDAASRSATPAVQANNEEPNNQGPPFRPVSNARPLEQDLSTIPRSLWAAKFKRTSNSAPPQDGHADFPGTLSESDFLTRTPRRLSNDTAQRTPSVVDSVFTRPSSIVSSATSWDSIGRSSTQTRLLWKKNTSCSSISSTNRFSTGPLPEIDLDAHPVPLIPPAVTAWPSRSVDSWAAGLNHSIPDQITDAGRMAQQHRAKTSRISEIFEDDIPDIMNFKKDHSPLGPDICADNLETPQEPALSTIDEGNSDAGCSILDVPIPYQSSMAKGDNRLLSIPRRPSTRDTRSCVGTDTMTELSQPTSAESRQPGLTPATSVAETDPDDSEGHDMSEDDESMSNVTDETDESFYEAFVATSLDPGLLHATITLKDHITSLVLARVTDWVRSCSPGQPSGSGSPNSAFGANSGAASGSSSTGRDGAGRKRGFDEWSPGGSDRGNGDDQDKRQKTNDDLAQEGAVKMALSFACPFPKRHPDKEWPRCHRGFSEVHRVKEHIYRRHKLPISCERCFQAFKKETELTEHRREADPCQVISRPEGLLGIDGAIVSKLKSRKGARNGTQKEKWEYMYKTIFPDVQDTEIPSPYFDLQLLGVSITPEMQVEHRRFIRKEIPPRVIGSITRNLNEMPEFRDNPHFSERRLSEVIHRAVWDAFDHVLPSLLPQSAPPETPCDDRSPAVKMQAPAMRTNAFTPQSTQSVTVPIPRQASPRVPETIILKEPSYPNMPLNAWSAQTYDPLPNSSAHGDSMGGQQQSQPAVAGSGSLNSRPLSFISQSNEFLPPSLLQFMDFNDYLDFGSDEAYP
ncbi:hypothetical protein EDB80DRAFT_114793 [Ilyonectria destructans]|nr:hypothetical protein EDB80DRAFT_114793 [Ilyonectria destructans]